MHSLDIHEAHATAPQKRQAYDSPRLSLLGDVCSLTETGSMTDMEGGTDMFAGLRCAFMVGLNTTGMC